MAQVWECVKCGFSTWEPKDAGDHERKYYGKLIDGSFDPASRELLHYMDDIGE